MKISAYIPCYNNRGTIACAVASIRAQSHAVDELFVVDDGSADGSAELVESLGERVIRLGTNLGRGAARARAMREAQNELVLACDATVAIQPDFLERALKWFAEPQTVAVFGRIVDRRAATVADRWRNRHLFKSDLPLAPSKKASLITGASVLRKSGCEQCGGYNPALRHTEDADLGARNCWPQNGTSCLPRNSDHHDRVEQPAGSARALLALERRQGGAGRLEKLCKTNRIFGENHGARGFAGGRPGGRPDQLAFPALPVLDFVLEAGRRKKHPMKIDVIYAACYKYDLRYTRILVASIRAWYPDIPILPDQGPVLRRL